MVPDEIEHSEHRLVGGAAEANRKLLKEADGARLRAQHEQCVDLGDQVLLIDQVDAENGLQFACPEGRKHRLAPCMRKPWGQGHGVETGTTEVLRHEFGVCHGDAEADGPHGTRVGNRVPDGSEDQPCPCPVGGEQAGQRGTVVLAPSPVQRAVVGAVSKTEVVQRGEQATFQRVPQPHLRGDTAFKEHVLNIQAVHAFGSRRQAEQLQRPEVVQDSPVRRRGRPAELVDDDHVEVIGRQCVKVPPE